MAMRDLPGAARSFAVAGVGDGAAAIDVARRVASWAGARGLATLVLDARGSTAASGARLWRSVAPLLPQLDPEALRSALALRGGVAGMLRCDGELDGEALRHLGRAYQLILAVADDVVSPSLPALPALAVVSAQEKGGLAAAWRMIDAMLAAAGGMRPVAFALAGGDAGAGARLAARWRLPFWGLAEEAGHLAERILDRSIAVADNAAAESVADGCAAGVISTLSDRETPPHMGKNAVPDPVVRDILEKLRAEESFRALRVPSNDREALAGLRLQVAAATRRCLVSSDPARLIGIDHEALVVAVVDEAVGFGPLEPLLADDAVTEVMVNGPGEIYAERGGVLERTGKRFAGGAQLLAVIERMVAQAGRRVDESSPMVDARLPDGSRVNAVLPPIAIDGPAVTIRKFAPRMRGMEAAVDSGMLTEQAARFLAACVRGRASIVVAGGTGSGKTTLLGILAGAVDAGERIVTIEDAAELRLEALHVVRLEARPAGIEGSGAVTIRDLVRNALRMRPDRIVVGECRGPEALDMLQAMNTGHEGSLTTVHANSPRDALARLETMVLMAGAELPLAAVREQVVRAIDLVVQVARRADGSRRIVEIAELAGMEGTTACLQTIASLSSAGDLAPTGIVPRLVEKRGIPRMEVA